MHAIQAAWMYYQTNPALVLNGLALFYALAGGWLWVATQLRCSRAQMRLATSPATPDCATASSLAAATIRINRLFYAVGGVCLMLALLLTLISDRF